MPLISPVNEIDRVYFTRPKSGRAMRAKKVVIIRDGSPNDLFMALLEDNTIVTNKRGYANAAYLLGNPAFEEPILKGLLALDVIGKMHMEKHLEHSRKLKEASDAKNAASSLLRALKGSGLKPTPEQLAYIEAHYPDDGKRYDVDKGVKLE